MNVLAHATAPQATAAVSLGLLVALWLVGHRRRSTRRSWSEVAFGVGVAALAAALVSPIETAAGHSFWVHMIQHLLLTAVAAPALAFAGAARTIGFSFGGDVRSSAHRSAIAGRARRTLRGGLVIWPIAFAGVHLVVLAAWHLPTLFDLAVRQDAVHLLEHVTLLGTALALWSAVLVARRRAAGAAFAALFVVAVGSGVLGALITFAPSLIYDSYRAANGGLTPFEDQQLAGVLMWVPGGIVYLGGALALVADTVRRAGRDRSVAPIVAVRDVAS